MNKKAEQVGTSNIIYAVLTVFLILLGVLFLWWIFLGGGVEKAKALFPSWGFDNKTSQQIELLRYDILSDELKWYDGVTFNKFQNGKLELNNKLLEENVLKTDLTTNYYHKQELLLKKTIKLDFSLTGGVLYSEKNFPPTYCGSFIKIAPIENQQYKKNSIIMFLYSQENNKCTNKFFGEIVLLPEGKMTFQGIDADQYSNSGGYSNDGERILVPDADKEDVTDAWGTNYKPLYDKLYAEAYNWRNLIFNTPITLHYKENNVPKTEQFCVEPVREIYLTVDLTKPSTNCERFSIGQNEEIQTGTTKDPRQDIIFEYDDKTSFYVNLFYRYTSFGWQWSLDKQKWLSGENNDDFSLLNSINAESVKALAKMNYLSGLAYLTTRVTGEKTKLITQKVSLDETGKFEVNLGSGVTTVRYYNEGKKWLWSTDTIDWQDTSQCRNVNAFTPIDRQALGQNVELILTLKDKSSIEGAEILFDTNTNKFPV